MNTTDSTITRGALIELDLPTDVREVPAPVAETAIERGTRTHQAAEQRLESTWETQVVSDRAAALVDVEQSILAGTGLEGGELLFAKGTAFADIGWQTQADDDAEFRKLLPVGEAAVAHRKVIAAEARRDRELVLPQWRLNERGALANLDGARAIITPNAWGRFASEAPDGTAVPHNLNSWLPVASDRPRVARVRNTEGPANEREIYALVSTKYAALDSDEIIAMLATRLPSCRAEVTYDRATTRTRIRVLDQAPIDVPALSGVGRVHALGINVQTRDDGLGSLFADAFLSRRRCLNASLSYNETGSIRRRHLGSTADMAKMIDEVLGTVPALIAELRGVWARAAADYFLDSETGAQLSAPEAIIRLVAGGHLPLAGTTHAEAIDCYTAAWRAEDSPHSAAGVIMAVQRAAHEGSWKTKWADETLEAAASELLYQPNYQLAAA